jgi:hypothetical protein
MGVRREGRIMLDKCDQSTLPHTCKFHDKSLYFVQFMYVNSPLTGFVY